MPAEAYDAFVEASPQGSVFCASWWLDAVAAGSWRPNSVGEGDRITAAWPTVVRASRLGPVHSGAPLTPFLGPLFEPADTSEARRHAGELASLERLLEGLGPYAHLEARCNPAFDYWTPLHWHGFTQTTHYTWRLGLGDIEAAWAGLRENVRREVRKARKRGVTVEEGSLEELLGLQRLTAERQGHVEAAERGRETIRRLDPEAARRGVRSILLARDEEGRVHAGAYIVWDSRFSYYLLGGSDETLRTSGAGSLVLWSALEAAAERGTGFDFEGSMLRPVERYFRSFGGAPAPYSLVRNTRSRVFRIDRAARRAAQAARSLPRR